MAAPSAVTPVAGGWDTQIWRVADARGTYALRVFRSDQFTTCEREAAVMRALYAAGFPVPRVHAAGASQGRPALLLSWCAGQPLLAELKARPWRAWPLGVAFGRMHARLHAQPVPSELQHVLPAWDPRREDLEFELLARLTTSRAVATSLLHLDYHPLPSGQWSVVGDQWSVRALLTTVHWPLTTRSLLRIAPLPPGTPAVVQLVIRPLLEAAWRAGYRHQQPADPFVDMPPFYAWAGALMERDLRPKLGRPGVWLQESDLARIRRWTNAWKQQNT